MTLSAPITTTPVNSNTMVAHATRYQVRPGRTRAIVATTYTTAASADSEYASGASSNFSTIWTSDRPVAASASTP